MQQSILEKFQSIKPKNILVVGDLILDKYIIGNTTRLSPEAPVPVIVPNSTEYRLGGAANVAANLIAMGNHVTLIGAVGLVLSDEHSKELKMMLDKNKIESFLLDKYSGVHTKVRIISNGQQVARIDYDCADFIKDKEVDDIVKFVKRNIKKIDAVVISDYNKGFISSSLVPKIREVYLKFIVVAPKQSDLKFYEGANIFIANRLEFDRVHYHCLTSPHTEGIIITEGAKGATLDYCKADSSLQLLYKQRVYKNLVDVTGSGDVFLAAFTVAFTNNLKINECIDFANVAGGIKVSKFGTSVVSLNEINNELKNV